MKNIYKVFAFLGIFIFSSCELDYLDSPNDVTLSSANPDFLMNQIQTSFAGFFSGAHGRGLRVTRIWHQGGNTYEVSNGASAQNGTWGAYSGLLQDIQSLKELTAGGIFFRHQAVAKILEAYTLMTLVDIFGDIPYTEALDPNNFNPVADDDATVYLAAFNLLQEAKADLAAITASTPNIANDLFYGNNATRWTRLANTLELRYHLNRRLIDAAGSTTAINALIAGGNLLQAGDDFVFRYGSSAADPDSRHPQFAGQFPNGGGDYQSTYFMWHITEAKKLTPGDGTDSPDPRANYYFYRQAGTNPTLASEKECIAEFKPNHYDASMVWCLPGTRGYWGRDHMDPDGIPPDNLRRTLYGVYPAGALFDDNTPGAMNATKTGGRGAGIQPIMLTSFVDFMLSEAALTLGTTGDPRVLLLSGIQKHIDYVRTWSLTTTEAAKINTFSPAAAHNTKRDAYVALINTEYNAAAATQDRLRIIAREYWKSLYGSGLEAYNLYRRTGMPDNMQPGQVPDIGKFPRSFFYPNDYVVRNRNAVQKTNHDATVFWDTNPAGFID